jgi:hypothetical protein
MSVMVLDAGISIIKAKIARRERGELAFPHALRPLTENEYSNILSRTSISGLSPDYVRVNGKPYVVGESAEHHGMVTQRTGTARYTRDYHGVLFIRPMEGKNAKMRLPCPASTIILTPRFNNAKIYSIL